MDIDTRHKMETLFPAPDEVIFIKMFDASLSLVWRAWTEPEMMRRWWGPHGFDVSECEVDLRVGGQYRIVARGPDGTCFPVKGVYLEIDAPHRLIMTDDAAEMPAFWRKAFNRRRKAAELAPPPEIILALTLEDTGAGVKMVLSSKFPSTADRAANLEMGSEDTWRQSFEKLGGAIDRHGKQRRKK